MDSLPEKRRTQIDFRRLKPSPRPKNSFLLGNIKEPKDEKEYDHVNDLRLKESSANISLRKTIQHQEEIGATHTTSTKVKLPGVIPSGVGTHEDLKETFGSPWQTYEKSYDIRLGADNLYVTVAERKDAQSKSKIQKDPFLGLVLARSYTGSNFEDKLREFQQIQHGGIVSPLEIFKSQNSGGTHHIVFEYMAYSLHYVAGNPILDEIRLAAIVAQQIDHPCVHIPFIIAGVRSCIESRYIRALGMTIMELTQGYPKESGAVGVEDLHRWPSDCNAVSFLSMTVTATSLFELTKHPLLRLPWRKEMLQGLVSFVSIGTRIGTRYPPT
ncbi:hypothetical protein GQ44DRAFT_788856 [Phaeosphaeriaceae sp. PMI808]|nr:hypothetical protein GQ44DRAFT_788856 [Phaeosphaeriaceae sp. PMI808]